GTVAPSRAFDPKVKVDTATRMRSDGSNVDIDQEMAEVSQNSGYSQTMAKLLQVQFKRLREAITELPN
ncbi:MAG: flagellar basal body rod protein FlgB, partial [Vulcanimicrobiaceae bacterium]